MSSRSSRWKDLERHTAAALGGERVTTPWDLFQSRPDVLVCDFGLVCDCKAYNRFAHHRLMENIKAKYCKPGEVPVLVTKEAGQHGAFATVPLEFLAELLNSERTRKCATMD